MFTLQPGVYIGSQLYFETFNESCVIILVHGITMNKLQKQIQIKKSKSSWELLCQPHLGTIVPISLGNNRASVSWKQPWQCTYLSEYNLPIINHTKALFSRNEFRLCFVINFFSFKLSFNTYSYRLTHLTIGRHLYIYFNQF